MGCMNDIINLPSKLETQKTGKQVRAFNTTNNKNIRIEIFGGVGVPELATS